MNARRLTALEVIYALESGRWMMFRLFDGDRWICPECAHKIRSDVMYSVANGGTFVPFESAPKPPPGKRCWNGHR